MLSRDDIYHHILVFVQSKAETGPDGRLVIEEQAVELSELDSFTLVELIVSVEDLCDIVLLDELGAFTGRTFGELADFIMATAVTGSVDG